MNTYEVMFLFDPAVGANWETVEAEINRLMTRAEAEVIVTKKLEERRLAYEIKDRKRGLYVLTYFRANGGKISGLERDLRLSEVVLRALVLRAEGITEEKMRDATLGGVAQEKPPQKVEEAPGQAAPEPKAAETQDQETKQVAAESTMSQPELVSSGVQELENTKSPDEQDSTC